MAHLLVCEKLVFLCHASMIVTLCWFTCKPSHSSPWKHESYVSWANVRRSSWRKSRHRTIWSVRFFNLGFTCFPALQCYCLVCAFFHRLDGPVRTHAKSCAVVCPVCVFSITPNGSSVHTLAGRCAGLCLKCAVLTMPDGPLLLMFWFGCNPCILTLWYVAVFCTNNYYITCKILPRHLISMYNRQCFSDRNAEQNYHLNNMPLI